MPEDFQTPSEGKARRMDAHAILVGDRLTVDRSGRAGVVATAPFCFRQEDGYVAVFRYGAVVLIGLSPGAEKAALAEFSGGSRATTVEEEKITVELHPDQEEGLTSGGILQIRELSAAHALVLADILAKSVALARYEKELAAVFDTIEPAATTLAISGRIPRDRKALLQLIGSALLAQHRVSGRIAFAEKPEILWEHPELERFYAKLEDEFEIVERGTLLNGKMTVLGSAAETFTDLIDTARSARLELFIVLLIVAELVIGAATMLHR
jgi:uncharacterized Rmd1/YagE family protein